MRVHRPWSHAPHHGTAGAFLIGDAAHPVSPVGAQGANMAVADARVLAELLLDHHPDPLAAYEHRRRPANARSVRFTRLAAGLLGVPDRVVRLFPASLVPRAIGVVSPHPALLRRVFQSAATTFG